METGDYQEQGYEFLIGMNQQVTSWQKVCKNACRSIKSDENIYIHNDTYSMFISQIKSEMARFARLVMTTSAGLW